VKVGQLFRPTVRAVHVSSRSALVQFGWEKTLGDDAELTRWVDAAGAGARWL
jgi:hypothetical protein